MKDQLGGSPTAMRYHFLTSQARKPISMTKTNAQYPKMQQQQHQGLKKSSHVSP